jgi:regulatory protein YycI of two-component signal transduction system YycFG
MDWSKAKTYLILTFLFLDLLLCYQWWTMQHQASVYVDSFTDEVTEVKELLASRHIQIKTEIPKETPALTFLRAHYIRLDTAQIAQAAIHNPKPIVFENNGQTPVQFQGDKGELILQAPSTFIVNFNDAHQKTVNAAGKEIFETLSPFMDTEVWSKDKFDPDYVMIDANGNGKVHYAQMYHNYPVFPASLDLNLQHGMITGYQETVLDVSEEDTSKKRQVLSAVSALRSLAGSLGDSSREDQPDMEILNIRLGYYGKPYNADNWYLSPMWRFVTKTKLYYVNAITGEVESTS